MMGNQTTKIGMTNEEISPSNILLNNLTKMKFLRFTLYTFALIVGLSLTSLAQQPTPKEPPPKKDPPVVVVKDKDKEKPKDENKEKPSKPDEFVGLTTASKIE
jgi:hypothetical protein